MNPIRKKLDKLYEQDKETVTNWARELLEDELHDPDHCMPDEPPFDWSDLD